MLQSVFYLSVSYRCEVFSCGSAKTKTKELPLIPLVSYPDKKNKFKTGFLYSISPIFGDIPTYYPYQYLIWIHHRNLTWNLKIMVSKWTFLFQGLIFRFHVKFRGCISSYCIFICTSAKEPGSFPWFGSSLTIVNVFDLPSVRIRVLRPHQASPNDPDRSTFFAFSRGKLKGMEGWC